MAKYFDIPAETQVVFTREDDPRAFFDLAFLVSELSSEPVLMSDPSYAFVVGLLSETVDNAHIEAVGGL